MPERQTNTLSADLEKHPVVFAVSALGILVSFVLLLCSTGTNDIRSWESFAKQIRDGGIFALYAKDRLFNHPPLMGWWAWLCLEFSSLLGVRFAIVFKLWPVLANVGAGWLLWSMWRKRGGTAKGARAFALFSWALCPILVAAYHGNTDCTCVAACLLAVYCFEVRKNPLFAGLAIALAINVKLIAVLVALPLLAACRSRAELLRYVLGSAAGAVPFLIGLAGAGGAFVRNVFGYTSSYEIWGVHVLFYSTQKLPGVTPEGLNSVVRWYFANGKYFVLFAILALTVVGYLRQLDPARLAAAAMVLFLVLTPGFGVQYTVYPAPMLFAVSLMLGMRFSVVAGIFCALVYASWSLPVYPLESVYHGYSVGVSFIGFAAWLTALFSLPECLRPGEVRGSASPE